MGGSSTTAAVPAREARSTMYGESGFERRELDAYFTEPRVTDCFAARVPLRGKIREPAAGRGDMVRVLECRGYSVIASDIADHGCPGVEIVDFLMLAALGEGVETIVTNPPYDQAERFVERALLMTRGVDGMVGMLLRHEWDCAAGRRRLCDRPPFAAKWTLTFRPRWDWWEVGAGNAKAAPRHNFAWFVWDWRHRGPAVLGYLP